MNTKTHEARMEEFFLHQGIITLDQLYIAKKEQLKGRESLETYLIQLGFVSESIVRDFLAQDNEIPTVDLAQYHADQEALKFVPETFARSHFIIPLYFDGTNKTLTVAVANIASIERLTTILGTYIELKALLATKMQIADHIDRFYQYEFSIDGILREIEQAINSVSNDFSSSEQQPVSRLVDAILIDAIKQGASDIHLEPEKFFLRIRYRIDGVLRQVRSLHKSFWSGISVRLKIMANMDITETRSAQDGHINLYFNSRLIDFRVSSHPILDGENIVLRILDRQKSILSIDKMDLSESALKELNLMMKRPEGMIIVTGPTGSGKTTTLYAMLSLLSTEKVNIMTLENPVEYPLPLMRQTSIAQNNKMNFSNGVRSMLRQDPDIILIGEIRDEDTAIMAFRAAMTGHQVFTTLHTNSVFGAFPRLLDLGVLPGIMSGNIIGIVAQRLVRALCKNCRQLYAPSSAEIQKFHLPENRALFKAQGCSHCGGTGYRGRIPIVECLRMDREIDDLLASRALQSDIYNLALKKGFVSLAQNGIARALEGEISLDELSRRVDLTNY